MSAIKLLVRHLFSTIYRTLFIRNLAVCSIAEGSRINFWRIRSANNAVLSVGQRSLIRTNIVYEREAARIEVGERTFIGRGLCTIAESLQIGNDVLISWDVTITDHNSHSIKYSERAMDVEENAFLNVKKWEHVKISPVVICDKVWIGFGSSILKGVTIGEGAIVAANSVVTKSVPPWTVVGGNPARVIRILDEDSR